MINTENLVPEKLFREVSALVEICGEIFLVGGAPRNSLLGKEIKDFDFVVKKNSIQAARQVANHLEGDFFILDQKRKTARAIIDFGGEPVDVDFVLFNGTTIEEDLAGRDFTINAIAVKWPPLTNAYFFDPMKGVSDMEKAILRPCSKTSFDDDPVRAIRAIRFLNAYHLSNSPETGELMIKASRKLGLVSMERKRDELLKVIEKTNVFSSLSLLDKYDILPHRFPFFPKLKSISLSPPHTHDAFAHTLQVVDYSQQIASVYSGLDSSAAIHPRIRQAHAYLKDFNNALKKIFKEKLNRDRSIFSLFILAAIFHDSGKSVVEPVNDNGRKRFPKHAKRSAEIVSVWAKSSGFSKREITYLVWLVKNHMKPSHPKFSETEPKAVHLHRFYKKTGNAGLLVALLHMADVLATYEDKITDERWEQALRSTENILEAYINKHSEIVAPKLLLNGRDVVQILGIQPGKDVGNILTDVLEAQVSGLIKTRSQAIAFIRAEYKSQE